MDHSTSTNHPNLTTSVVQSTLVASRGWIFSALATDASTISGAADYKIANTIIRCSHS